LLEAVLGWGAAASNALYRKVAIEHIVGTAAPDLISVFNMEALGVVISKPRTRAFRRFRIGDILVCCFGKALLFKFACLEGFKC